MKTRLANLIKTKRKELKLSQKALAEGICTQTIISRIEKGEITPSVDIFFKIIKKLCIPMDGTTSSELARVSESLKAILSSDCRLQLAYMKPESLVIADQHAAVNTFPGLVHTARHTTRVCNTQSR